MPACGAGYLHERGNGPQDLRERQGGSRGERGRDDIPGTGIDVHCASLHLGSDHGAGEG